MLRQFLLEPTRLASQREEYGVTSNQIAEFYCTISNIGLFLVALYYHDYATFFAALFSTLSHAFPYQRLHDLDIIGVVGVGLRVIYYRHALYKYPTVIVIGGVALLINLIDTWVTRRYLKRVGPWLHVVWHLSITFALYKFNEAVEMFHG